MGFLYKRKFLVTMKSKLIFMMVAVSIIPMIFLFFINIEVLEKEIKSSIHAEHELLASTIAQNLTEMVVTTEESLENIALTNPEILIKENITSREDIIYRILKKYRQIEEIAMISQEGKELVKISKKYVISPKELKNIKSEEKFQILKSKELYIGTPFMDLENQMIFEFGIPIGETEEQFLGAIVAKVSLRQIMNKINSTRGKNGSYIFLIDENGSLIAHSEYDQVTRGEDVRDSLGVKKIIENKNSAKDIKFETAEYKSYSGKNVLGVYGTIPIVGWGIIVEQPLSEAYEEIPKIILNTLVIFLVSILFVGVVILFSINLFMKSINELGKGVNALKSGDFNYRITKKNNDEIGNIIEAFNSMTDEIQKKRKNEVLVMSAEKNAAIGTLAAGVAHEINNPMNNLGFYTEDLLDRLETEDINYLYKNKIIQEYLEIMKEQINRCSAITGNLLKISRDTKIEIKSVNLQKVVEDILKLMEHRIKKQNIDVVININDKLPIILVDESQMQQMLLNIIINAVDAMEQEGILTISINIFRKSNLCVIKIKDTGYGIKNSIKSKIFDPFYTTKPIGKGTGLGLSISQGIIERMRGTIDIESKEFEGTEVNIKLPISSEVNQNGKI